MKNFTILTTTLSILLVFQIVLTCGTITNITKNIAVGNAKYCSARIDDKLDETLDLLTALSKTDIFQREDLTYREKAAALTKISKQFGYMMIRVLDKDLRVYNENSPNEGAVSSDLSNRDYLQKLKNTLEPQITDAFLAGADGKTVNFTVAVPIQEDGVFKGAIFAAIYETDFATLLAENNAALLGTNLQYMSGVEVESIGMLLDDELDDAWLFDATTENCLAEIIGEESKTGYFSGIQGLAPFVLSYSKVENVKWNVISRVPFSYVIADNPAIFVIMTLSVAVTAFLIGLTLRSRKQFLKRVSDNAEDESAEE